MKSDDPREDKYRKASEHLHRADDVHGFELANGIYRPESKQTQSQEQDKPDKYVYPIPQPMRVDVGPDWPIRLIYIVGLFISALTLVLVAATVFFARQQWVESHRTADASIVAAYASRSASETAEKTLREMKTGSGAQDTHKLAVAAGTQAAASREAAGAAKSAADTAKQSLEISERAYLTTDAPVLSSGGNDVGIPIVNRGHIPSGEGFIIVHEATIDIGGPATANLRHEPIERHWKRYPVRDVPPSLATPMTIPVVLPSTDISKINSGTQQVILAGSITFNDGFPNTRDQVWSFCYITILMTNPNRLTWGDCDLSTYINPLILGDKYPNNEYQ